MVTIEELHLAFTAGFAVLLWLTQGLIYPQFERVPPEAFAPYHAAHLRGMARIVGPLFLGEGACALLVAAQGWAEAPARHAAALALFAAVYGITFARFVGLHRRLERGHDAATLSALIRENWLRTAGQSLRLLVVLSLPG
jgi:hypothetical protein